MSLVRQKSCQGVRAGIIAHFMKNIVILISGSGSNMGAILHAAEQERWAERLNVRVAAVISNKADAQGLALAQSQGVATAVLDHKAFASREAFDAALMVQIDQFSPSLVVLAGFMRILTPGFVAHYAGRLLNIHPSLLPAFPGLNTHQRAIDAGCKFAGATVHQVTADLDHGPILAQAVVPVLAGDTAAMLAARVLTQEHLIYPPPTWASAAPNCIRRSIPHALKTRLQLAIELGHFGKHGRWPHPQALFAIECLVQRHRLQVFAVAHGAQHAVLPAFVMTVEAFGRFNQGRQSFDACADLVRLVLQFEHPADAVVSRYFREHRSLGPRERATLAETAFAVLRKKLLFEQLARSGSGPKERKLAILGFFGPRDFLASALNDTEKKWLATCDAIPADALMAPHRHNLPEWMAQALQAQLGEDFWALSEHLQQPGTLDLRVNMLQAKRSDIQKELAQAGMTSEPTPYSPWGLRLQGKPALQKTDAFTRGAIEVQDEGSQLLALLVDAHRGEMVVDFCAGAGGKTLALGASMRSTGRLYAFDVSGHRLDALKPRMARSGLSNVHPAAIAHERDERVKRLSGKIDRVLVDAPCSGLGTLRRNPDLKWRQKPQAVQELTAKQQAILQSASRLVKSGGRLVYATCSVLPEENELIAQAFSAANPDFMPLNAAQELERLKVPEAASLCTPEVVEPGQIQASGLFLRLWPHRHGTDGFFAAAWVRK
eukprot:gene22913-27892_t